MRTWSTLSFVVLTSACSVLGVPVLEPFSDATSSGGTTYSVGSKLGFDASLTGGQTNAQGLWWAEAGTTVGTVSVTNVSGNLNFADVPGYSGTLPASSGNSISAAAVASRSPRMAINSPTGGQAAGNSSGQTNIFASFLLKVTSTNGMTTTASFFAGFNNTVGTQTSQPSVVGSKLKAVLSGTGFKLGVEKSQDTAANVSFEPGIHTNGETIFVVLQYTFGTNSANGTNFPSKMWINPSPATFGASVAPAATATSIITTLETDISGVTTFIFFQRATTHPSYIADELRVSYTWAGVTGAPDISSQPASRTNNAGTAPTFSVSAVGANTLSYQWSKGGVPLSDGGNVSGATMRTLTLSGVLAADAGSYTVVITNDFGSRTSSVATLTVNDPAITTQLSPANQSQPPGAIVNYSVVAAGTPTLTYQWKKDGTPLADGGIISGATTANLTLNGISAADAGTYTCAVTNGSGSGVVSSNAVLSVIDPAITSQPQNVTTNYGSNATFTAVAAGTGPLTYQWVKNVTNYLTDGGNISGAATVSLTVSALTYLDAGGYTLIVTNGNGNSVTSSVATLTVRDPFITAQPTSQIKVVGSSASFSVGAAGSALAYTWKKGSTVLADGGNISGATTATLTLANVATADAASYSVVVTNSVSGQSVTSSTVNLSVVTPPASRTVNVGDKVTFVAVSTGTGPFSYQWYSNNVAIAGATFSFFSKANLQTGDSADYSVTVNNPAGAVSPSATLTVSATRLRLSPTNLVVLRLGEGSQTLANTGNTLYLDQFTTNGSYLNTIMVPDSGPTALLEAGNSSQEGYMSISADRRFLMVAGYNVPLGYTNASLPAAKAVEIPRAFGAINGLSYYTLPISSTVAYDTDNPRCAVTDGTNSYWTAGSAKNTRYFGPAGQNVQVGSTANTRVVEIFNGDLYYASASGTYGIHKLVGLPTSLGTDTAIITTGNSASFPADFAFDPAGTTIYIAEDAGASANTNFPGVNKWTFDSGSSTWVFNYTIPVGTGLGTRQMTVDFGTTPPTIYAVTCVNSNTTAATANTLIKVQDNGPTSVPVTLATAGANQGFRGIRFGPLSDAPVIAGQPASRTNGVGSTATFSATVFGTDPRTYQWVKNGTNYLSNGGNISGANTATLVLANVSHADEGSYSLIVTNDLGSATSSEAVLTVFDLPVITADPQSSTNNAGDTVSFTVSATSPSLSYQWRKNGSNLTDGGNVSGASSSALTLSNVGVTDASNYNVVVSNPGGSVTSAVASLTVICPAVGVTPASLPDGTLNASYSQTLSGTGGAAPYSFGVTSGSLPAGLTLSSSGVVSGVPTATGTNNFTATATDAHGCAGSQPYTIVINCPVITLSPSTLPDGVVGASYNQTVTASGGVGPYTFAVSAGTLPTGVNLSSSGNLSGTLSNAGAYTFTLTATGSAGCQGSGSYTVNVATPAAAHFDAITLLPDNNVRLTLSGSSNVSYDIQASSNLSSWDSLISTGSATGTFDYSDLDATNSVQRFYRAVWMP